MSRSSILIALVVAAGVLWLVNSVIETPPGAQLPEVELDHSRPRPQGGFYRCPVGEPETMNPFVGKTAVLRQYVYPFTHEALAEFTPETGALRPALATALPLAEPGSDPPTFVFELRDGVSFSDGTPLTMTDVEFTFAAAITPGLPLGEGTEAVGGVTSLEPIDARSFRITLDRFRFAAAERFATKFRIVQARWFRQRIAAAAHARGITPPTPGSAEFRECLLEITTPGPGTGPYQLHDGDRAWHKGVSLTMTQNPHCWRRTADPAAWNLAGIQLLFSPTLSGSVVAALNGEIDFLTSGSMDVGELLRKETRLREQYRLESYQKLLASVVLIVWNCKRPPFDRPEVRRALTMLFDRQAILDGCFHGHGEVAWSWFPPGSESRAPELAARPFAPEQARRLLDSAGCSDLSVEILCPTEALRAPLLIAQAGFRAAGVDLEIRVNSWELTQRQLTDGDFDGGVALLMSHDAIVDPGAHFASQNSAAYGGYASAEFDAAVERANHARDPSARTSLQQDVDRIFWRDQPVTLLVYPSVRVLIHRRFRGVEVGKLGLYPERWWVEAESK